MSPVHPVLGPLPPALNGITVEVAETLAAQVLISNHTPETLEILDPAGRPFVRIGPRGVEADLAASAWYETVSTLGPPVPEAARDPHAPAHWAIVRKAPEWGWFDPRVSVAHVMVGSDVANAQHRAPVGRWSIPVRIGGRATRIAGVFEFRPIEHGGFFATIATQAGFPASIAMHVSQGAIPAVFLQNTGTEPVTIIGMAGEPEMRIGPGGVSVNTGSPTWRQFGREERKAALTPGEHWLTVSTQPAYTWMEPRGQTDADGPHATKDWTIPVLVGSTAYTLHGTSVWIGDRQSIAAAAAPR